MRFGNEQLLQCYRYGGLRLVYAIEGSTVLCSSLSAVNNPDMPRSAGSWVDKPQTSVKVDRTVFTGIGNRLKVFAGIGFHFQEAYEHE